MDDRVFICYSRKDEDFVLKLAASLKDRGVPIWLDQWDIPKGANWPRAIDKALSECACLLVVLSPSSVESDEVQSEWYAALDDKKTVIPILYQTCRIPFRLKPIQRIDFTSSTPGNITALDKVLEALGMAGDTITKPLEQRENKQERSSDWCNEGEVAIKLDHRNARAWNNKGFALGKQGKHDEAIKAYDVAIKLDPKDALAWYNKGFVLYEQGKRDEAIKACDMAIKLAR